MDHQPGSQPSPSTKVERKVVEKNRRDNIKRLHSKLYSLLPNRNPEDVKPLPDQLDEATNYIKSLETRVKMGQEKKKSLIQEKKRILSEAQGSKESPKFVINETGSALEVVLTCGVDSQFIFYEIIRILHEENVDVVTANFGPVIGDSVVHTVHGEIPQSFLQIGETKVSGRLKNFVNASLADLETEPVFSGFEIGTQMWSGLMDLTGQGLVLNPS